ncbi:lytic polysaccharide monooxygenase [Paractinoplanes lichenicola]|uniref:Lytic polysaccharide monooxygenase n=1 Tax=Paractinoplanes lichenicola TaxID=2802976 RepID=A0ABS1VZ93_9ACTN|nr:lytic polysaccharide monooxygenase [Actinoplanes lichenicola]MBL7259808.1 lytic polysaccharide monooxygenase [Actinoplanes lichenicola]
MTLKRRLALLAAAVLTAPLIAIIVPASPASAHGWITSPPSRQDQCATGAVANCGSIQYEPQSVEAPKGSMSCSGGSSYTVLNDDNKGWRVTSIGSSTAFTWRNTAMHRTQNWQYYVDGRLHQTFTNGNAQPPQVLSHQLTGLPSGRHKILAVWNIFDTAMAFYSCVDVNVSGGGTTNPPTTPPTNPPTSCGAAWSASAVYTGGMNVSHKGRAYTARYWTQGEEPGTTGEWGAWQDKGAC